jgi:putative two-component system response regulator
VPNVDESALKNARLLIVDDQEQNVALLVALLKQAGYTNLTSTTDSSEVIDLLAQTAPDLILLDLHMPHPDGFELMEQLGAKHAESWFQVLVLTADVTSETKERALSQGASDFVGKPFDRAEVLLRIGNLLKMHFLQLELRRNNLLLEKRVFDRTQDLNDARLEVLKRLAFAAEYRDDATGQHAERVGRTSSYIARALGLDDNTTELIRLAAPLHDIGKIGVTDDILLKPGKLTPDEFERMKAHTTIGAAILTGSRSPLLQIGEQIARTHHERFEGGGYPAGSIGKQIPLPGRIVAVADVFDALTHDRPYKEAWTVAAASAEIRKLRGFQFDPDVVDAFEELDHDELLFPVSANEQTPPAPRDTAVEALAGL